MLGNSRQIAANNLPQNSDRTLAAAEAVQNQEAGFMGKRLEHFGLSREAESLSHGCRDFLIGQSAMQQASEPVTAITSIAFEATRNLWGERNQWRPLHLLSDVS